MDKVETEIGVERLSKVMFWPYPEPLPIKGNEPVLDDGIEDDIIRTLSMTLSHVLDGVPMSEAEPQEADISFGTKEFDGSLQRAPS